jgi:hypothetical protein
MWFGNKIIKENEMNVVLLPRGIVGFKTLDGHSCGGYYDAVYKSERARLTADPCGMKAVRRCGDVDVLSQKQVVTIPTYSYNDEEIVDPRWYVKDVSNLHELWGFDISGVRQEDAI